MRDYVRKKDRIARLLRIQVLLWQHSDGLEIEKIARTCSISARTVYRDLETLESELGVPVWAEGNKRGITEGYFLPPITFSKAEAMNIFLAARLTQNYSRLYNPSMASTFMKLNTIVPPPLRKQIQNTLEYMEKQPRNERKMRNFDKLTEAWLSQHRVKILYRELTGGEPEEHTIEPYFIEPAMPSRSSYVIAYSALKKSVCTFKIDLIIGEVTVEADTYEIPSDFNAIDYFGSSWGIFTDEKLETVKLLFNKRMSKGIMETIWHPSQKTELQKNGSLIMTLRVRNTVDFRAWILGWGDNVEVLAPEVMRNQIIKTGKSILKVYHRRK